MTDETTTAKVEVMDVLSKWSLALWNRDLEALGRCYAEDVRVFDLGAQMTGFNKLRALWETCLPYFPSSIGVERKDLQLSIGSDMAVATFYSRLTGMASDHPSAKSWLRTTVCLSKQSGEWKIIHDHVSLPVDCGAEKPTYIMDIT
jgi:ketosteroid isomerase-like protein